MDSHQYRTNAEYKKQYDAYHAQKKAYLIDLLTKALLGQNPLKFSAIGEEGISISEKHAKDILKTEYQYGLIPQLELSAWMEEAKQKAKEIQLKEQEEEKAKQKQQNELKKVEIDAQIVMLYEQPKQN